jgi:hypothetical protein
MAKTGVSEPRERWPKGAQSLHCSTRSASAALPEVMKVPAIIDEAARVRHGVRGLTEELREGGRRGGLKEDQADD